ncbi:hypothetical protein ACFL4T_04700 [candidate division KSB1 bacterium]
MEIDWSKAKKKTLWHYEDLIEKMLDVLDYSFVQKYYNYTMLDAATYSKRLQHGYLLNGKETSYISQITRHFEMLSIFGVKNYLELIQRVSTKANCELFLKEVDFSFEMLIQLLNFLFRWVLPFKCTVKELVETISKPDKDYLPILKELKIRSNLDILEKFRTRKSRSLLSIETGIKEIFILELTHRADISRLAYVRGKTIKHLCGGGYSTLDKIASADMNKMEEDMTAYYVTLGKSFSDFKAVIPLDWMIGGAKVLPKIIEV